MHVEQVKALRAMTPGQRLEAAQRLYWSARALKEAALRCAHPEWTGAQVEERVKEAFRRGTG